jgi:mono/diheme cytochrome c family protein
MPLLRWLVIGAVSVVAVAAGCGGPNPQPTGLTPIPTLAPGETVTLVPEIQAPTEISGTPAPVQGDEEAALGAPIYLNSCTPCHGLQGEGVDAPALRNSQYLQTASRQSILTVIAEGVAGSEMPGWLQANGGPLTDAQITSVIAYLHTLQGVSSLPGATPEPEEPTPTPLPPGAPTPEPARPSNPGEAGPAASQAGDPGQGRPAFGLYCASCHGPEGVQGIPNPGSDDGTVPVLSPIDPTIASQDASAFAVNVDLFIEHGSVPEGPAPLLLMPSFGDAEMLTDQEISNLIAYVMMINGVNWPR